MMKNHNKGPIGPLDPDEPPPADPTLKRHHEVNARDAVKALRSLGVPITEKDLELAHASGGCPAHRAAPGQRLYTWGELLDYTARTFPRDTLTREEATKFICEELGYPIGPYVLSQLAYSKTGGPPFVIRGRYATYAKEDLRQWVEEDRARGRRNSTAPKYLPLYAKRQCPHATDPYDLSPELMIETLRIRAAMGREPPPAHKACPWVKHPDCASHPRALCNLIHLKLDPALFKDYEARGILRMISTQRPSAYRIEEYLWWWQNPNGHRG